MELIKIRKTSHALSHGGIRWIDVSKDSVAFLRESSKETILVFVSRKGVKKDIDLKPFGYAIKKNIFGPSSNGHVLTIRSREAVGGIWQLT
jgi:alpha-glucosidase